MARLCNSIWRTLLHTMMIGWVVFVFSGCDITNGCDGDDNDGGIVPQQNRTISLTAATPRNMAVGIALPLDADSTCQDTGIAASPPQHGTISGGAPNLVYTPINNFTGTDPFSWVIQCGQTRTTFEVQVQVTYTPPDEPPNPEEPTGEVDWLHTIGNRIVDRNGEAVWLTGANWFGFNASERVFHGLWTAHLETMIQTITQRGINILRVPISTQLIAEWMDGQPPAPVGVNYYANPELEGMNTLELFDFCLSLCEKYGLKVLLDVHSAEANNSGHVFTMWYTESISTDTFYKTWEWVARRYKNNDTLIAFDIENEPHGKPNERPRAKWDNSTDVDNWKYACEQASKRILAINPNVLVLCEGIEVYPMQGADWSTTNEKQYYGTWWGGNLRGVDEYPINLGSHQDQLVYSPHDYGPVVFAQSWFNGNFTEQSLYDDVWHDNWFFIQEKNIAPLLIGEWGGLMEGNDPRIPNNIKWMNLLRGFIIKHHIHHTFWCINPNSGDTGGLINDDWMTWNESKYEFLKSALWQDRNGKFVGLDHDVPLGGIGSKSGISLNQFYQNGSSPPIP